MNVVRKDDNKFMGKRPTTTTERKEGYTVNDTSKSSMGVKGIEYKKGPSK